MRSKNKEGDTVALLVRHRSCDLQVAGSSPDWVSLHSGLGQATYTYVCLCHQAA